MKNRFLNRFSNLLMLFLGILPLAALVIDSFAYTVAASFMLWAAGICFLMWLSANFRYGAIPGIAFTVFFILAAGKLYAEDVRLELSDFFDRLTGVYYEHFYAIGSKYPFENAASSHTFILLLVVLLLAAYMSMSLTSKSGRTTFSLLGSLPIFAGCIAVNGRPSVPVILCLILFWTLLFAGGNYYSADSNQGRGILLTALPVAAALYALILWQKPEDYDYDHTETSDIVQRFDELGASFSRWMSGISGGFDLLPDAEEGGSPGTADSGLSLIQFSGGYWGMGDGTMDMRQNRTGINRQALILRARAETSGYLYLRSFSYGDYTGTGWKRAEEPGSGISSLPFTGAAVSASGNAAEHSIDIQFSSRPDVACIPYYSALSRGNDSYVSADGDKNYSVSYRSFGGDWSILRLPEEYAEEESAYRSYAHSYYTSLPDSTKSAVLSVAQAAGINVGSSSLISDVAVYVKGCVSYDVNTEPYPSDDYALYFFTQAETGYCIHFATAAAVMYRALGIPARVTDGFLVSARAGEYVDVLQANEHAWVEVYLDGLGWIPVEVTGSAGFTGSVDSEDVGPEPTAPPEESMAPEEPGETPQPVPTAQPTEALPVGVISSQPAEEAAARPQAIRKLLDALPVILVLILLFSALPLSRLLSLRLMQNRISLPDQKKAAVWVWKYAKRAEKFGAEVSDEISRCAEKAAFSQHGINESELRAAQRELNSMLSACAAKLKGIKKLIFKFLYIK